MPRIRNIKPDFFTSEKVTSLPFRARLTWIGLWTYCDDEGRCRDNARLIKAAVYPLDDLSDEDIQNDLDSLLEVELIRRYSYDGKGYLYIPGWEEHQYVSKPTPSKLPDPPPPGREIPGDSGESPDTPGDPRETPVGNGNGSDKKTRPQLTLLSDSKPDPLERFPEFYAAYPRRVSRRAAEKAWLAAIKRKVSPQHMIDAAVRHADLVRRERTALKYVKYPASWINAGSYDDVTEVRKISDSPFAEWA